MQHQGMHVQSPAANNCQQLAKLLVTAQSNIN